MFTNLKHWISENADMIIVGTFFTAAVAAVTVIAVTEAKADAEENRQAIEQGKTVVKLFGQKAIF